jgi:hypothetical protein
MDPFGLHGAGRLGVQESDSFDIGCGRDGAPVNGHARKLAAEVPSGQLVSTATQKTAELF